MSVLVLGWPLGSAGWSAAPVVQRRVALFGDSRMENGHSASGGERAEIVGIGTWVRWLTGGRCVIDLADNFGVSGDTTAQMLARLPSVLASPAQIVIFLGATNDFNDLGVTLDQTLANMRAIRDGLLNAGKVVIWVAETPRGDSTFTSFRLGANLPKMFRVRAEILSWQGAYPNLWIADPWSNLADPLSTNGDAIVGRTYDGLHPSATGAYYIALAIKPALEALLGPRMLLPHSNGDIYSQPLNPFGGLNANPMMSGTGGNLTPNGGTTTGQVADSWTLLGTAGVTAAAAKVTGSDGRVWQQLVLSGTAGAGAPSINLRQLITSNVALGDQVRCVCEFEVDAGASNITGLGASVQSVVDSVTTIDQDGDSFQGPIPNFAFAGVSESPLWLRSGTTLTNCYAQYRITLAASSAVSLIVRIRSLLARRVA